MADNNIKHDEETIDNSENGTPTIKTEIEKQETLNKDGDVCSSDGSPVDNLNHDESEEEEKTVTDESSDNEENPSAKEEKLSEEQSSQTKEDQQVKNKKSKKTKSKGKDKKDIEKKKERKRRKLDEQRENAKRKDPERKRKTKGSSTSVKTAGKQKNEKYEDDHAFSKESFQSFLKHLEPLEIQNKEEKKRKAVKEKKKGKEAKTNEDEEIPTGNSSLQEDIKRKDKDNTGKDKTNDQKDETGEPQTLIQLSRKELLELLSNVKPGDNIERMKPANQRNEDQGQKDTIKEERESDHSEVGLELAIRVRQDEQLREQGAKNPKEEKPVNEDHKIAQQEKKNVVDVQDISERIGQQEESCKQGEDNTCHQPGIQEKVEKCGKLVSTKENKNYNEELHKRKDELSNRQTKQPIIRSMQTESVSGDVYGPGESVLNEPVNESLLQDKDRADCRNNKDGFQPEGSEDWDNEGENNEQHRAAPSSFSEWLPQQEIPVTGYIQDRNLPAISNDRTDQSGSFNNQDKESMNDNVWENSGAKENGVDGKVKDSLQIQNTDHRENQSYWSKIKASASSLLGLQTKKEKHYFYVDVQDSADNVFLVIHDKATKRDVDFKAMEAMDKYRKYWKFKAIPIAKHCMFFYVVVRRNHLVENFNDKVKDKRTMDGCRSDYSVFQYQNYRNNPHHGLFWFAKHVYLQMNEGELSLEESLAEYDQIQLGFPKLYEDSRRIVAQWIDSELAGKGTKNENVVFLAHVIQHFDQRLLKSNSNSNLPILKDLIKRSSSEILLNRLRRCTLNYPFLIPDVEDFLASLICRIKNGKSIEMLVYFVSRMGNSMFDKLAKYGFQWLEEDTALLLESKEVCSIINDPQCPMDKSRLLGFILKRAPSVQAIWKLQDVLREICSSFVDPSAELFRKTCRNVIKQAESCTVFDKTCWPSIPDKFKSEFAESYLKRLSENIKLLDDLNGEQKEVVHAFFTDDVVLANENIKQGFLDICKFPSMSNVIAGILRNSSFKALCWDVAKDDFKKQLYLKVLAISTPKQRQANSHVLEVFLYLNDVLLALDVCPLDGIREAVIKKCHSDTNAEDLKAIASVYEEIEELHPEACEQYHFCLQRSIEKGVKEESPIIEVLKTLQVDDEKQKQKVKRITKETMLYLSKDLEISNKATKIKEQGFEKDFQSVMKKRAVWATLLDVWPPFNKIEEFPEVTLLVEELQLLRLLLKEKNIRVRDLNWLGSEPDCIDVLQKMDFVFLDQNNEHNEDQSLCGLLSSCLESKSDSFKKLENLLESTSFVKRITKDMVDLTDIDEILKDIAFKKKHYKDAILSDVLNEDYWSSSKPFLDRLKDVKDLQQFQVYRNTALSFLEKTCSPSEKLKSHQVLTILVDNGRSRLNFLCEPLLYDVGGIDICDAEILLQGISESSLETELGFIRRCANSLHEELDCEVKEVLLRFINFDQMRENLNSLTDLILSLNIPHEVLVARLFTFFLDKKEDYKDLQEMYDATEKVIHIERALRGPYGEVVRELAESAELVKLLQDTAHDDVRNLIDAVEEHSDTTIKAKEVSDFIEIHKLFAPVFKAEDVQFSQVLIKRLHSIPDDEASLIAARIKASSYNAHSLRNVYKNVANRGEMTKEIVEAALKKGTFYIFKSKEDESWKYSLSYTDDEEYESKHDITIHNMERLLDIKSRALLIVNSEKKQPSNSEDVVDYQDFINQIDLLNEIILTGEDLQKFGHPEFQDFWFECSSLKEIQAQHEELREQFRKWERTVENARNSNFYLNFFHPKHLWTLKEFFLGTHVLSVIKEVLSLLRFVDGNVTMKSLNEFNNDLKIDEGADYDLQFSQIGICLERFFGSSARQRQKMTGIDAKRGLSVAVLEKNSSQTAAVVMTLYEDLQLCPNKLLFCHENSTWDEIMLFLRRCFSPQSSNVPYCLANVESLDTDLQFQLVDTIRAFQVKESQYWLVLVCRGGDQHHIVNQFRESTSKKIKSMSNSDVKRVLSTKFPDVFMVTSDLPGLGKTELIHEEAARKRKRLVSFPINGPVERRKLVHRLLNLGLDENSFLHIDISEVDDPLLVDSFLFELIVMGMVSSSTKLFHLPTFYVAIEVANTLEHHLRDALTITKCFKRNHINWENFRNYICSQEKGSAIQVVCQYLCAYEKNSLETETLSLKDLREQKPLSESECQRLLKKYSPPKWGDLSFNTVEIFLNVLALQLIRFSSSPFFRPEFLKDTIKETGDIRVRLFEALKDVSIEFAKRSVVACKEEQTFALWMNLSNSKKETGSKMVDRVEGMVRWAEENHLVVMFQKAGSISALFRELKKVPKQVQELFESQNAKLRDLEDLKEDELETKLKKILIVDSNSQEVNDGESYVLTPDNILKMILIIQRIRARVPVIVMGETGCGKTSLVRYLARSCDVELAVMNFHAGIYEDDIVTFTEKVTKAKEDASKQVWVFFDEINTCDYLGLINDIICHRCLNGKELPPNIVFIAACNPYCLRSSDSISTAGLAGKSLNDEYSNLVYRVKPLPETMMDYVWDYGSLDPSDERAYIQRMVAKLATKDPVLVVDLLATAQEFIRKHQSRYSVSLRDVRRCILLAGWFMEKISKRSPIESSKLKKLSEKARSIYDKAQDHDSKDISVILALAHSYQSRITSSEERKEFRSELELVYRRHRKNITAQDFDNIVRAEQEEYLARMDLPDGTARNTALRENVFVMLVCILNRIPVFVVGKPGCSKSLSMQVIVSNLRGKDSKDNFFRTLPQLLVVSYQGSESSTSEGIIKVFDKAQKYREQNKEDESLPVVLLDEVGLAEISKYNPLKVLHRLLEPEDKELPDVAVVGISNWALDAAKMNRAIHLSRPEPTLEDLEETGQSILEAQLEKSNVLNEYAIKALDDNMLRCLAKSYHGYQKDQVHDNFHGLRDYYSLIKCLSQILMNKDTEGSVSFQAASTFRSLQRNFGGLSTKDKKIEDIFVKNVKSLQHHHELDIKQDFPVTDLITDNLQDQSARHLMLITSGESALGIIDETLSTLDKEKVVINGSKFEEDQSEDYSYRTLSRIILHMERECVLVLRDLESVYGSLYDMLNQNYIEVGKKKNCRVALGPYSNPMCQVHDGFRCIVLVNEENVDYTDPPFLNRFEKQLLRYTDVLEELELKVISELKKWVRDFSTVENNVFTEKDVFLGLKDDTLASLVLLTRQDGSTGDLLQRCKEKLLDIATPDGVLRSLHSKQYRNDPQEVKIMYENYFFDKPLHNGLKGFIDYFYGKDFDGQQNSFSRKYLVVTHSSIHTDVDCCLKDSFQCQVERLGAFKSERQLSKTIQQFWQDSCDKDLLVVQCKPNLDFEHMVLMKSIIEQYYVNYLTRCNKEGKAPRKSVCIIIHLQRGEFSDQSNSWQFTFLQNWKQGVVDSLEEPDVPVSELLGQKVVSMMEEKILSLEKIMAKKLMWCFTRLKYPHYTSTSQERFDNQVANLKSNKTMMQYMEKIVLRWITRHHESREDRCLSANLKACDWQVKVACNRNALLKSSTLSGALLRYIDNLVRQPLAKAIFLIEDRLSFECCQRVLETSGVNTDEIQHFLADLITDENLFNIDDIPDPHEPRCYDLAQTDLISSLNFPFSLIFNGKVDSLRECYLSKLKNIEEDDLIYLIQDLQDDIQNSVPQLFRNDWLDNNLESYIEDVFNVASARYSSELSRGKRLKILKAASAEHLKPLPDDECILAQIYLFLWQQESNLLAIIQLYLCCNLNMDLNQQTRSYIDAFKNTLPAVDSQNRRKEQFDGERNVENGDSDHNGLEDDADDTDSDKSSGDEENDADLDDGSDGETEDDEESEDSDDDDDDDDDDDIELESDESSSDDDENTDDNEDKDIETHNVRVPVSQDEEDEDQDEEDEDQDEEDEDQDEEDAKDTLIAPFLEDFLDALCASLLPKKNLILKLGGTGKWQTIVNTFITQVAKSTLEETSLYIYLRICSDFTNMVLDPHHLKNPHSLYMLSELCYKGERPGDPQNCFKELFEVIDSMENLGKEAGKFKTRFLSRCLAGCETEEFFQEIVATISSFTDKETIQMSSPLIFDIITNTFILLDLENFEVSYSSLLQGHANDNESIEVLDEALNDAVAKANEVIDCHFVTVCLDAISKFMPDVDVLSDPSDVCNSNSEIITCLKTSLTIVKEPRNNQSTFKLLIAVAYLRSFLSSLAELIHDEPTILRRESKYSNLFGYLTSSFEVPEEGSTNIPRRASFLLYFLKELRGKFSMYELRSLCEDASQLSSLTTLHWTNQLSMMPCYISPDTERKTRARKALFDLMESNDSSILKAICSKLSSNVKLRIDFSTVLMEDLYLPPIHNENMDKAADTIAQLLPQGLHSHYKRLVLFLVGKANLKFLDIFPEHLFDSAKATVVVLHLLANISSKISLQEILDRPFFSYLLKPLKAEYILANPDSSNQDPKILSQVFTCSCGTAFVRSDEEKACPQHRKLCSPSTVNSKTLGKQPRKELSMCIANTAEDDFFVSDMTPSSFRLLHLLVHSALFGGMSMEISTEDELAKVLCIDATDSPAESCFKEITNDLLVLQRLWGCSEDETVSTVHHLIEDLSSLITKPLGGPSLTEKSRKQWQKEFSEKVEKSLPRQIETIPKVHLTSLEAKIEEKDSTDNLTVDERNSSLPRLFRSTKEATFNDLCSKYHTSTHTEKKKHPLVALFLKYFKILPKHPHLYQLMNFSNMLLQRFGRRLSRNKASKYIEDVIKEDSEHYEELKEALDKFCLSWEFVRPDLKKELGEEVPHLSETSPTSYFLVDPGSDGRFLQAAIQVLQRLQNDFQGEVLHLANEGSCRALDFLNKSDTTCTMPLVHVQDVMEDEIICFEWDDQILCHSYLNTDYGRGKEIYYDFDKIELELAGRFLIKKVYLGTPGGLRYFPYSNELFRTCSNVLNEVHLRIHQVPIDANMQNRLNLMKDTSLECVQDLLEHLEVIICLLAKATRLDSDMTLLEYIEKRLPKSNLLPPKLFQDPKKEFKVCHVLSMYQTLEEVYSIFASKNISDKYRSSLSKDVMDWLQKTTDNLGADKVDELTVVLTALRRFIFRYLLTDQDDLSSRDPHEDIVRQLDDPSLWPLTMTSYTEDVTEDDSTPVFKQLISEFVPRVMRAGEVHAVVTFYDEFVKAREKKREVAKKTPSKKIRHKIAASFGQKSRFA